MTFGLIARPDARGLGIQCKAVHDNLHPTKTLVVNCTSAMPLRLRRDWYPNAHWIDRLPTRDDIHEFLDGLDSVYTAETGYTPWLWTEANRRGIKTVLHGNYEFLDRQDKPAVWAAPSRWHFDDWPAGTIHLPVPIETHRFTPRNDVDMAARFLHVIGRPAIHDRNGTIDLLKALPLVRSSITLTITCQQSGHIGKLINDHHIRIPDHITLNVQSTDTDNYWNLYQDQDTLIMPRRFGGLCLPALEAIGAGMPVIMPDIDPNNTWMPGEWLTPAIRAGEFRAKQHITYYQTEPEALADRIDQFAQDQRFYRTATTNAHTIRAGLSWTTLKPRYQQLLLAQ